MAFLLAELGTSGSLDGQQRLVVKGRFAPKNFEGILRRYISTYCVYVYKYIFSMSVFYDIPVGWTVALAAMIICMYV